MLTSEFSKKGEWAFMDVSTELDWLATESDNPATKMVGVLSTGGSWAAPRSC
jgi:hypothetical protein